MDASLTSSDTPDTPDTPISAHTPTTALNPEQWVAEHGDDLFRYALSRLRDNNAAEEVVQETFLAGVRHLHQYSGAGSERAWLLGILKRKIIDYIRQLAKRERTSGYEDEADPSAQLFDEGGRWRKDVPWSTLPEQQLESRELWEVVRGCLSHLPEGQAAVFTLSVMENLDTEAICRELGITPANLWVRLHRARLGLAKCVSAKLPDVNTTQ
ncbi:MAG: sigma-70 family RNA polymerase sigma factor [Planctomycetales bacterium]|nr:sigma-70 family RNA polymerase sigma factor [Planctomycetales bacterium]